MKHKLISSQPVKNSLNSENSEWQKEYSHYKSVFVQENRKKIVKELEKTRKEIKQS